jgi:hypothetical protein
LRGVPRSKPFAVHRSSHNRPASAIVMLSLSGV